MSDVLVVYSGGLDSFTLLNKAAREFDRVSAITFNYGQKHKKEIQFAKEVCQKMSIKHEVVDLPLSDLLSGSALVGNLDIPEGNYDKDKMKLTIVPNRNMIMISIAASMAIRDQSTHLWYAAHAGDHEIYPDCRPEFISKLGDVLKICDYHEIILEAPFQNFSKAEIISEGLAMKLDYSQAWTCYEGRSQPCLKCSSCLERESAFKKNNIKDPII